MGGLHRANAGTVTNQEFQPFDGTPGVFDNDVFKRALEGDCALHIDCQIAFDKELRPFVEQYANSQPQFFRDYTIAYQKMMGMTPSRGSLTGAMALNVPAHANLVQEGTQALPFRRIPKVVNQACPRGFS